MKLDEYRSGAVEAAPTAPVSPSVGFPTAGNPATATPATRPGAYWLYQVQAELHALLTAGGVTPDAADLDQLVAAVRGVIAGEMPSAKTANGWVQFPGRDEEGERNGLVLQWMESSTLANAGLLYTSYHTLPVAFASGQVAAWVGFRGTTPPTVATVLSAEPNGQSVTSVTIYSASTAPSLGIRIFAIGY